MCKIMSSFLCLIGLLLSCYSSAYGDVDYVYPDLVDRYQIPRTVNIEGICPYESYFKNTKEAVSPASGGLNVEAIDFYLPGRDGFDLEIKRIYNSCQFTEDSTKYHAPIDTFGCGWRLNIPWTWKEVYLSQIYLPNGETFQSLNGCESFNHRSDFENHEGTHFIFLLNQPAGSNTLIMKDGIKYVFDSLGRVTSKISANGKNTIKYCYNASSPRELEKIIDSVGREIKFEYKSVGSKRLIGSIQVGTKKYIYSYDQNNLLWKVADESDADSTRTTEYRNVSYGGKRAGVWLYNASGGYEINKIVDYNLCLLDTIVYPTGKTSTYKYLILSQNYENGVFKYRGSKILVDNHTVGEKYTKYKYQLNTFHERYYYYVDLTCRGMEIAYENSFILWCEVNEGKKRTQYTFNHLIKNASYRRGSPYNLFWKQYFITDTPRLYEYESVYQDIKRIEFKDYVAPLVSSRIVLNDDKIVERVDYQYDKLPILEPTVEKYNRGDQEVYKIEKDYDSWGNLTGQRDSRTGLKREITYFDHASQKNLPKTVKVTNTNPLNGNETTVTTTYNYHSTYLKPESIIVSTPGKEDLITSFSYHDNGNLGTKVNPNGLKEIITYENNPDDWQAFPTKKILTAAADGSGKAGLSDADGNSIPDIVTEYGYNFYGLKEWEMDGRGYATQYRYDGLDRLTKVYLPSDNDIPFAKPLSGQDPVNHPYREYIYTDKTNDNTNTCEFWNENRQKTLYTFDGLGRLIETVQYNNQTRYDAAEAKTVYHYNDLGQIDAITDPNQHTTKYFYDGLGRIVKIIYPTDISGDESVFAQLVYDDLTNEVTIYQENGNKIQEQKDWADRLIKATQYCVFGSQSAVYGWDFSYDSLGNKVQQTDPEEKITEYQYDPFGNREKVILPADYLAPPGAVSKAALQNPGQLTPISGCGYDNMGNKIWEISANGNQSNPANDNYKTDYKYDQLGRLIKTITRTSTINIATKRTDIVTATTRYFYDACGNKVKMIDPNGHIWEYGYSAQGFLLSETAPKLDQEDSGANIKQYRYDPLGNKIAAIDPRNSNSTADNSQKVWYRFEGSGSNVKLVLSDPRNDKSFTTWYLYDEYNRLYRTVLPDKTAPGDPYGESGGYDNPFTETWYDLAGNKIEEQDANGVVTRYCYTPRNWLLSVTGPDKKEQYEYDHTGNQTVARIWTDIPSNLSYSTLKEYDSLGRLRRLTNPEGVQEYTYDPFGNKTSVTDENRHTTSYTYNSYGWLTEVKDPLQNITMYRYDPNGNKVATITANNLYLLKRYDEQNRLIEEIDSLGKSTLYNYDLAGNRREKLDRRNTRWVYTYQDNNLLKELNLTGADSTTKYSVSYQYDNAGNQLQVTDNGNTIIYNDLIPDPLNRINAVERQFDGKTYRTSYEYNPGGQIAKIVYPEAKNGKAVEYHYNASGRMDEVKEFTKTNGIAYYADGLTKNLVSANNVTTNYTYNSSRRLQDLSVNVADANGSPGQDLIKYKYAYDLAGNIKTMTDELTGKSNSYSYYDNNWLKNESAQSTYDEEAEGRAGYIEEDYQGNKILDYTPRAVVYFDYASSSIGLDFGTAYNPTVKKIQLIPDSAHQTHRLIARSLDVWISQDNINYTLIPRSNWTFSKNTNGVITITLNTAVKCQVMKVHCLCDDQDSSGNKLNKAQFINELAQMIRVYEEVEGTKVSDYQYNSAGNRILRSVTLSTTEQNRYFYYPDSNRLFTDEEYGYVYDNAGNLIQKGNKFTNENDRVVFTATEGPGVEYWEYDYDLLNRLIEVRKNQKVVAQYGYDPTGLRVVKRSGSETTHYVFEGDEPIFEKKVSSGKIRSYIYALGKHLARVDGAIGDTTTKVYYYHTDQVGSIRKITDQQGKVVWDTQYEAFGNQFNQTGSIEELHSFTGKELDPDTGLYYFNARWYDSELGRFVSEDPEGDPNNPNLYVYCANNPLVMLDPTGNWNLDIQWSVFLKTKRNVTPRSFDTHWQSFMLPMDIQWPSFLRTYTEMDEVGFTNYLTSQGIDYSFNENNSTNFSFINSEGQRLIERPLFATDRQKHDYYNGMVGNIKEFLERNPGLSLEQVKGMFDSAVISADNPWGGGKDEFRYEGRGSNYNGLYGAESVIVDQGTIAGVFTRASTLPDSKYMGGTVKQGVYDYETGMHTMIKGNRVPSKPIPNATTDTYARKWYKALNLYGRTMTSEYPNPNHKNQKIVTGVNSHAGMETSRGSQGCQTVYYKDYYYYISLFNSGEIGQFIIIR
jgi:RHS repeat-associated protein